MATNELAKAKLKVMGLVPYVQKQKAPGLKYSFAGEAAIIERLHPAMREAGLTFAPSGCQMVFQEAYKTGSGTPMNRVIVQATFVLTHAESGQAEMIQALGEGADSGDKATSKAMTSALKYALRQAFLIETGDDPDTTPSEQQHRAADLPRPTSGELAALLQRRNRTWEWALRAINKNAAKPYSADTLPDHVLADDLAAFVDWLRTQPEVQAA